MSKTRPPYDDETDLLHILIILWDGKWKIGIAVAIFTLSAYGILATRPTQNFVATTEIKPISSFDKEIYRLSNNFEFFEVTSEKLLSLFIEQLEERKILEEAIVKHKLLDAKDYEDEQTFNDAVIKFASSINILPPMPKDGSRNWQIEVKYSDKFKLSQMLVTVNLLTNQNVKNFLQKSFENSVSIAKQIKHIELEDLELKISNTKDDFNRLISDRLVYLREQADIARTLGIEKNVLGVQAINTQNEISPNKITNREILFYMRGYKAIEREIELTQARRDNDPFIDGLVSLEQEYRSVKQDMKIERAETLFSSTPIITNDNFSAASIMVLATKFRGASSSWMTKALLMASVVGGIIGSFFVLISNALRNRKKYLTDL